MTPVPAGVNKGTHKAVKRLSVFTRKVSRNYTGNCFVLKLDIKKFFASVDHAILMNIIKRRILDKDLLWLIENIVESFSKVTGIPIGNLTSQIFANIYLNELDQFIKHKLKVRHYIRYCDDFVIVAAGKKELDNLLPKIEVFLRLKLKLSLHDQKKVIRKYNQGIDFLGYIVLPFYILPRTKTRKRIYKKLQSKIVGLKESAITESSFNQTVASYLGFLKHFNSYRITRELGNQIWFWLNAETVFSG